jgi:phosphatidyl-myo-inositol dimannoside synthase
MSRNSPAPSPRPRLLILTPDFPPAPGGVQQVVHRLAAGMSAFQTLVVALGDRDAAAFDEASELAVRRVRAGGRHGRLLVPGAARIAALNALSVGEALRFRPQLTLSAHIVTSPAAALLKRLLRTRTCQYFYAEEIGARRRLAAFAAREADLSIAISSYTADLIAATGARPRHLRLIPPGVDIPADPAPSSADRPTILTIARLEERYKGHDVMLRALPLVLAKVPDAHWVVIGEGSLRPSLEELARAHGVTQAVSFLGALSDAQRDHWLRRADLLAMPSRLPGGHLAGEGFGIVYVEAGAFSKPALGGRVGGALDAIVDGETGLLVDPSDPVEVAEATTRLLLDRELASKLGRAGAHRASELAWPAVAARVQAALLELLESP